MDMHTKYQLTMQILSRYCAASREIKGRILDEYCANTGYQRKYAIAKLRTCRCDAGATRKIPGHHARRRVKKYDMAVEEALHTVWDAYDNICAERLHPTLGAMMDKLIVCGELAVDTATARKLRAVPLGTLKLLCTRIRIREHNRVGGTTKPGTLLKHDIPLRVGYWDETKPGFVEVDTVAQCGDSAAGIFAHTLNCTDIVTGWFEAEAVLGKAQEPVFEGLKRIRRRLPFALLGIDSDNGYEFINWELFRWCKREAVVFTRSRPYKKNDNAHIEQKNWTCVRKVLGYTRIETRRQVDGMNMLYRGPLRDYINFFLPSMRCVARKRVGSRIVKTYDEAKTPYARALLSPHIPEEAKMRLRKRYEELNPVALKRTIAMLKKKIFDEI